MAVDKNGDYNAWVESNKDMIITHYLDGFEIGDVPEDYVETLYNDFLLGDE